MSSKDRKRAEAGLLFRNGQLMPREYVTAANKHEVMMRCGKCKAIVPEHLAEAHLLVCQGEHVKCGTCGLLVPTIGFIKHYQHCITAPKVVKVISGV